MIQSLSNNERKKAFAENRNKGAGNAEIVIVPAGQVQTRRIPGKLLVFFLHLEEVQQQPQAEIQSEGGILPEGIGKGNPRCGSLLIEGANPSITETDGGIHGSHDTGSN